MNLASLKKLFNDHGVVSVIVLIVVLYALSTYYSYFSSKGTHSSSEGAELMKPENKNSAGASGPVAPAGIQPADEKPNEYSLVNEIQTMAPPTAGASSDLLPIDGNNQWSQLSPAGAGELQGINLLKSGYHIGIDTIGQTLRNANLQIRSEPPNPQINVGPWNQSTISPDLMRVPLELGCGSQ
jgi:hypothetical protein